MHSIFLSVWYIIWRYTQPMFFMREGQHLKAHSGPTQKIRGYTPPFIYMQELANSDWLFLLPKPWTWWNILKTTVLSKIHGERFLLASHNQFVGSAIYFDRSNTTWFNSVQDRWLSLLLTRTMKDGTQGGTLQKQSTIMGKSISAITTIFHAFLFLNSSRGDRI